VEGDTSNLGLGNDAILIDDGERVSASCGLGADTVQGDQLGIGKRKTVAAPRPPGR
jgi:hypothetical protein